MMKLLLLSLFFSSLLILMSTNLLLTFYYSSSSHSLWMFFSSSCSLSLVFLYFIIYVSVNALLLLSIFQVKLFLLFFSQSTISIIFWLILSGVPPFSMFWLKVNVVLWMKLYSVMVIFYLLMLSVFSLSGYYFSFHLSKSSFSNIKKTTSSIMVVFLMFLVSCF